MRIDPPLDVFRPANLTNGFSRPTRQPNAWVAEPGHPQPTVRLEWPEQQTIATIELDFDTDFDHPMESVLMGHPERSMPFCVREVTISCPDDSTGVLAVIRDNHQTRRAIRLARPVTTACLEISLSAPSPDIPAALFAIRCYPPDE
jgi:hypothetical protein